MLKFLKHYFKEAKENGLRGADGTFSSWVCQRRVELSARMVLARSRLVLDRAWQLEMVGLAAHRVGAAPAGGLGVRR